MLPVERKLNPHTSMFSGQSSGFDRRDGDLDIFTVRHDLAKLGEVVQIPEIVIGYLEPVDQTWRPHGI